MPVRGGKAYRQSPEFRAFILERDGQQCQLCGCHVGEVCDRHYAPVSQMDAAHIVPFKDGGMTTIENMRDRISTTNLREGHGTQHEVAVACVMWGEGLTSVHASHKRRAVILGVKPCTVGVLRRLVVDMRC